MLNFFHKKENLFFYMLLVHASVNAQADSISSRIDYLRVDPPPTSTLSQSSPMNAWTQGDNSTNACPRARQNGSGVIISVTVQAPVFGHVVAFSRNDLNRPDWAVAAYATNSSTAQFFVQPGGLFCVSSSPGASNAATYFITEFRGGANPEADCPFVAVWDESTIGYMGFMAPYRNNEDYEMRCYEYQIRERVTYSPSRTVSYAAYNNNSYITSYSRNPVNGGCGVCIAARTCGATDAGQRPPTPGP